MSKNFDFINFEPENELKTFSKEVYWLMEERAPSRAAKNATITKADDGYTSSIKIISTSGTFEAEASSSDPKESINKTYEKMKALLKTWSENRASQISGKAAE